MTEDWLEIPDDEIDVQEIMRKIRENLERRQAAGDSVDPVEIARTTKQFFMDELQDVSGLGPDVRLRLRDCDITPRHYVVDWRIPVLGPLHAVVRKLIDAEIRRFLFPSLQQQSTFNHKVLKALQALSRENAHLRQELDQLRSEGSPTDGE